MERDEHYRLRQDLPRSRKGSHKKTGGAVRLDSQAIRNFFAVFTDLPDEELANWNGICESAGRQITNRLRKNADITRNMERLCAAAAAIAYCNYSLMKSGISAEEVRVGEITLKSSHGDNDALDAIGTRDYFLAEIADLIVAPSEAPVSCAECAI